MKWVKGTLLTSKFNQTMVWEMETAEKKFEVDAGEILILLDKEAKYTSLYIKVGSRLGIGWIPSDYLRAL